MKKVLSLLVIFTFLQVQLWAFAPSYASTTSNPTGTYAGVFLPTGTTAQVKTSSALGIFSVAIPSSTGATPFVLGVGVLFVAGAGYNMTISGVYDPGENSLQATIDGISNFTISTNVNGNSIQTNLFAQGTMIASLQAANNGKSALSGPDTAAAERLNGTASLDLYRAVNANGPVITSTATFNVVGFQQSSIATTPTLSTTTTGG